MATTNLIVDYLVIGVASFVWVAPILLAQWGTQWLCSTAKAGTAGAALLLGVAYVVGISGSRFADWVTGCLNDKIRDGVFGADAEPSYHSRLNFIVVKSESATEYLSYRRSIVRVSRACALHFGFGFLAWVGAAWARPAAVPLAAGLVAAVVCAFLGGLMFWAWKVVLEGYFKSVKDMHGYLDD